MLLSTTNIWIKRDDPDRPRGLDDNEDEVEWFKVQTCIIQPEAIRRKNEILVFCALSNQLSVLVVEMRCICYVACSYI